MSKKKKADDKAKIEPAKTKEEIEADKWMSALPKEILLSIMAYPPDADEIKKIYEAAPDEHVLAAMTKLRADSLTKSVTYPDLAKVQADTMLCHKEISGLKAGAEFLAGGQQSLLDYADAVAQMMIKKGICTQEEFTTELEKRGLLGEEKQNAHLGDAGMGNKREEPGTPESPAGEQGTDSTSR